MRGRETEAERVLEELQRPGREGEKEAWEVEGERKGQKLHWSELFHHGVRKRTFLACFLQATQQLSGIDGILFYAPTLFSQAGITGTTVTFLASGVSGLLQVVVTIICLPLMDRMGRRSSTIYGGTIMAGIMITIAVIYTSGAYLGNGKWVIIVSLYLFIIVFCSTWAMTGRLYASEIQPIRTRAAVSSISTACNQGVNTLVALTIPVFLEKTTSGPYWLFAACLAITAAVAWLAMPETRGLSFDAINDAFMKTKTHKLKQKVHAYSHRDHHDGRGPTMDDGRTDEIQLNELGQSITVGVV